MICQTWNFDEGQADSFDERVSVAILERRDGENATLGTCRGKRDGMSFTTVCF